MCLFVPESRGRRNKLISVDPNYDDDGIGSSDDETNSNSSTTTKTDAEADVDNDARATPISDDADSVGNDDVANDADGGKDSKSKPRRVIKPDTSALNRLLAFDEVRF